MEDGHFGEKKDNPACGMIKTYASEGRIIGLSDELSESIVYVIRTIVVAKIVKGNGRCQRVFGHSDIRNGGCR